MNQENDEKKQFISNEKFQLLQLCQQSVYQATESNNGGQSRKSGRKIYFSLENLNSE
jgi:hypothetical protein